MRPRITPHITRGMAIWAAHLALLAALWGLQYLLPGYHLRAVVQIMVLAVFAMGYNLAFGYTGLLSLGHALYLGAGMYAAALPGLIWGIGAAPALGLGVVGGALAALVTGVLALRTAGVAFMIVTLMFAQAGHLVILYHRPITGGDEGFQLPRTARMLWGHDLSLDANRYALAFALCAAVLLGSLALVRSRWGRVMAAMRENEERARMLGYDPARVKLAVLVLSGAISGLAGAAFALIFGFAGGDFATVKYSILPLLYVLLGGAGTVAGPLLGAAVMFYLTDIASGVTSAWGFVVGLVLVLLVLFAPKGMLGVIRARGWRDLP